LVPPILFTGCTLIGFGIGAISDGSKKGGEGVSGLAELRTFELGTGIVLITGAGTKIEGDFLGFQELSRKEYDRLYLAALETLRVGQSLPRPGDTISFNHYAAAGRRVRGLFRGVDPGYLVLWQNRGGYSLSALRNLEGDGARPLDSFALQTLSDEGRLPYLTTGILVDRGKDTTEVPVEDIVRIESDSGGNGKLIGALVGAGIDAIVIIAVNASMNETAQSCNKSWGWNNGSSGCHSASRKI